MCRVHDNRVPVISATPHVWNQNSLVIQNMFISSHEIEHSFSNKAQCLVYRQPRRRTKQWLCNTRSVADSSLVHSSAHSPLISLLLSQMPKLIILVPFPFLSLLHIFAWQWWVLTMTNFYRHLSLSTSPYCTTISSQYNGTYHYNNNAQHGARYNSIVECTTLPLPGKSQHTHLQ